MESDKNPITFRCKHRHSAVSHPQCYIDFLTGKKDFKTITPPKHARTAKILLLDIETRPGVYYAFDPRVEYLTPDKQIQDWSILCWSAKWLFEPVTMGEVVSVGEAFESKDSSILEGIRKLMDEAQIIITQNGINFDLKKLNARFIQNKMLPPSRYQTVDTLKVARNVFGFTYNRLDELGKKFGIGKKIDMEFLDWKKCLTNDQAADQALEKMLNYCKQDISPLLEDVYLEMLPWMHNHPNLNIYTAHDKDVCPRCESDDLNWSLEYPTPQGLWMGFRCNRCGSTGRGTSKEYRIKKTSIK